MPNEVLISIGSALVGGLITYLISNHLSKTSTDVDLINDHIDQVSRLEEISMNYWSLDGSKNPDLERKPAAQLNGCMTASSYFEADAQRLMAQKYSEFKKLDGELFDLATGGHFESFNREPDYQRVIELMTKCNEMRYFLRKTRRSVFGSR